MKKRIFALVFAITLMALSVFPVRALENPPILSELSVEEQLEILREQGVEISPGPEDDEYVTGLIPLIEADTDYYPYSISNPGTREFAVQIRDAVNRYYQRGDRPRPQALAARYTLQDSTAAGSWREDFLYYNCYAYALGRTDGHY